jgi:hypothetical protein
MGTQCAGIHGCVQQYCEVAMWNPMKRSRKDRLTDKRGKDITEREIVTCYQGHKLRTYMVLHINPDAGMLLCMELKQIKASDVTATGRFVETLK